MKNIFKILLISAVCFFTCDIGVGAISKITVEPDNESEYIPTSIVNGSFTVEPWMNYKIGTTLYTTCPFFESVLPASEVFFNGVNEGWNTTEFQVFNGNLFEYSGDDHRVHAIIPYNNSISASERFVEMNGSNSAILYQDLTTQGNDVILWKLKHAVTNQNKNADTIQSMRVEIGAPNINDGKIVNAHGLNNDINPEIKLSTKAIYRSTGVTDSEGQNSILGYAGSDIENLTLNKTINASGWYTASGVYIVPEDQNITRFGFIAEASKPNYGNLLDDIEFSTLIGNLNAVYNDDKSATVTGYWGEIDKTKKLVIKIGTETYELDMSSITGNFQFVISKEMIGKETYIEVYHEDFPQVKKAVKIVAGKVTKNTTSTEGNFKIVSDDDEIINAFDDETVNKVKHGEDISISLEINDITKTINKEDKKVFTSKVNDYTLGNIYDFSLYKKLDSDEEDIKVLKLSNPLEFSIDVPKELINKDVKRVYKILNYYDGKVEELNAVYDKDSNTLRFKTDKPVRFAIIYKDEVSKDPIINPDTGSNFISYIIIGSSSLIGLSICLYLNRKRFN